MLLNVVLVHSRDKRTQLNFADETSCEKSHNNDSKFIIILDNISSTTTEYVLEKNKLFMFDYKFISESIVYNLQLKPTTVDRYTQKYFLRLSLPRLNRFRAHSIPHPHTTTEALALQRSSFVWFPFVNLLYGYFSFILSTSPSHCILQHFITASVSSPTAHEYLSSSSSYIQPFLYNQPFLLVYN